MKIFVNRKIKLLFGSILLCICFFMLASALLIGFGVRNAAAFMMICFLLMSAAILALLFGYFREQHQIMEMPYRRLQNTYPVTKMLRLNVMMRANYTDCSMK